MAPLSVFVALLIPVLIDAGTVPYHSYPLAVKSPYLSAWMPGTYAQNVPTCQPQFWTGTTNLTWNVMARITPSGGSAQTYTLFGFPTTPTGAKVGTQVGNISVTATRTQVQVNAGVAQFTLNFMNLILPSNYTIHSLPYTYLAVSVSTSATANVQIFSAIGDSWTGQPGQTTASYITSGSTQLFEYYNGNQKVFTENNQQAAWGSTAYGTQPRAGSTVSAAFGSASTIYQQFISNGNLGTSNPGSQPSSASSIAAFSHALQGVTSTPLTVVFGVGNDRTQAINYAGTTYAGFYHATFSTVPVQLPYFLSYYETGLPLMQALDQDITAMGNTVSSKYADILDACVRQTYGAYELTIPNTNPLSTAATYIFEKEISSDGNINSIDSIFPEIPLLYLISPDFIANLYRPVLDYVSKPNTWNESYSLHDLGSSYPNATGYLYEANCGTSNPTKTGCTPEYMPLEVSAQLIIAIAAYAKKAGSTTFASQYTSVLTKYANYLASNGLQPAIQLSTVDAISPKANQVQLAVISAIALGAIGKMFNLNNYTVAGQNFATQLLTNRTLGALNLGNPYYFTYYYNTASSWAVMWPLLMDSVLGLNLFQSIYANQSLLYSNNFSPSGYGIPYSTGVGSYPWAITDWNFWSAAVSSTSVQNMVVNTTWKFMTDGLNTEPWGTKYNVEGSSPGLWVGNRARSTVGSNWAIYLSNCLAKPGGC